MSNPWRKAALAAYDASIACFFFKAACLRVGQLDAAEILAAQLYLWHAGRITPFEALQRANDKLLEGSI